MRRLRLSFRERRGPAVGASRTAARAWIRRIALTLLAGLFLAISGAFGTESAPFLPRLGFWLLGIGLGSAIGGSVAELSGRFEWPRGAWSQFAFIAVATAAPTTLTIWVMNATLFGHGRFDPAVLGELAAPVLVVTLVMSALNILAGRQPVMTHAMPASPAASEAGPPPRRAAKLVERLPPKLQGAELWAIEAEDHYLRLHTSRGSDLILLRLADALDELDGIEGAQTHRSWWVARAAVQSARRAEGRATLLLKGGLQAPVSRTYARALREAAWF
jgi:hypothetical protein